MDTPEKDRIEVLKAEIAARGKTIDEMEKKLAEKNKAIKDMNDKLERSLDTLNSIQNSLTWKLGQMYGRLFYNSKAHGLIAPLISKMISGKGNQEAIKCETERVTNIEKRREPEQGLLQEKEKEMAALPIEISLITNFECVYSCSYCFAYKPEDKSEFRKHDGRQWENAFHEIYRNYGKCRLVLTGGEPLFYKDAVDFVINTTKLHFVSLGTNLFIDKDTVQRIAKESVAENLFVSASYHLEHGDIDEFILKMLVFVRNGINTYVSVVAFPEYIDQMLKLKSKFEEVFLRVGFFPFVGAYKDRSFPEEYSAKELEIVRELPGWHKSENNGEIRLPRTKGMLCYAGVKTIYVNPSGEIRRCMPVNQIIGNVFDNEFSLLKKPQPCPVEICNCALYWKYHVKAE